MKYIKLTQNKQAVVDDGDHEELSRYSWYYKQGYAVRNSEYSNDGKRTTIRMHREIMSTPTGFETDHINHDKLDNRRKNLRIVDRSQNMWNRKPQKGRSPYKGVTYNKKHGKWYAQIQKNGVKIHIGSYSSDIEASKAYQEAASRLHGTFAFI